MSHCVIWYRNNLNLLFFLDNDANAAAYGEFWIGAGKDVQNMIIITLGQELAVVLS